MQLQGYVSAKEEIRPVVYGIGLYFFVAGTDSFQIGTIGSFLKIVALLPLTLSLLDLKKFRIRFSTTLVAQFLFWILSIVSLLYSINPDKTFSSVKALSLNLALVFFLGGVEKYNQRELKLMNMALIAGGWLTILMMSIFSDTSADGRLTLLLGGENQDQNYINGYFIYAFSWHCSKFLLDKKKLHSIPMVFILSIVLLTGSRGALLAFMLVFFVTICVCFANSRHRVRNIALVALLMFLLLVVFDWIFAQMPESVARRFSWDYIAEKGSMGRIRVWQFLLEHFEQDSIPRMLFGHGYGTTSLVNTLNGRVAHNLYIDNLITLGVIGVFLQVTIQASIIYILIKKQQYPLLGAYLGMLGMCLSLSLTAYKPIWNIMLLALATDAGHKFVKNLNYDENGRFNYESYE